MSSLSDQVLEVVKSAFPQVKIKTEHFVKINNQKVFFDIFLPHLGVIIEVHGKQHDEYVDHFHGNAQSFRDYRRRDRMKEEWADKNGYIFIVLREKDLPFSKDELLGLIENYG